MALTPRSDGTAGWTVSIEEGGGLHQEDFDLVVIATGLYSDVPNLPDIPGQEEFEGEVLHISQVKTRAPLDSKRVAVLGYGKSATDAALEAAAVADDVHIVLREPHWPVPRNLAGILPFKWGMLSRFTGALVPPYVRPTPVVRWLHGLGKPLVWSFWRLVECLLLIQWGLGTRIAKVRTWCHQSPWT